MSAATMSSFQVQAYRSSYPQGHSSAGAEKDRPMGFRSTGVGRLPVFRHIYIYVCVYALLLCSMSPVRHRPSKFPGCGVTEAAVVCSSGLGWHMNAISRSTFRSLVHGYMAYASGI